MNEEKQKRIDRMRANATTIAAELRVASKAVRARPAVTFGIVMNEQVLKLTVQWLAIDLMTQKELIEFILKHMRKASGT